MAQNLLFIFQYLLPIILYLNQILHLVCAVVISLGQTQFLLHLESVHCFLIYSILWKYVFLTKFCRHLLQVHQFDLIHDFWRWIFSTNLLILAVLIVLLLDCHLFVFCDAISWLLQWASRDFIYLFEFLFSISYMMLLLVVLWLEIQIWMPFLWKVICSMRILSWIVNRRICYFCAVDEFKGLFVVFVAIFYFDGRLDLILKVASDQNWVFWKRTNWCLWFYFWWFW